MGSKAWRNLGVLLLASAALVGCNNTEKEKSVLGPQFGPQAPPKNGLQTQQTPPNQLQPWGVTQTGGVQQQRPGGNQTFIPPNGQFGQGPSNFNQFPNSPQNDQFSRPSFPAPPGNPNYPAVPKAPLDPNALNQPFGGVPPSPGFAGDVRTTPPGTYPGPGPLPAPPAGLPYLPRN